MEWSAWLPATCMPDLCFCEADRLFALRQPINTISSLAFCLVGAGVVLTQSSATDRLEDKYLFWAATTLIGLGSGFYHASLTFVGQTFDVLGMYLLATLLVLWSSQARLHWGMGQRVLAYVLGNVGLLTVLILVPALRRYVFAGLVLAVLLLERGPKLSTREQPSKKYLMWAVALLAVGFAIWITDITKTICYPNGVYQGHAVWHLFGAASSLMVYWHYHPPSREMLA